MMGYAQPCFAPASGTVDRCGALRRCNHINRSLESKVLPAMVSVDTSGGYPS